ncbi:MAG: TIM barrel protein, partial [Nocardioidaceae bacterium]
MRSSALQDRVAGAPISWGVCEVPDWGRQLAPRRVLSEMRELGLTATEFGPDGFLEVEPAARARQLASYGLTAVGGFLPVVLHDSTHDPLPEADEFIDACLAAGASVIVLAAVTGLVGYDERPMLDDLGWKTLTSNLDHVADHAARRGVQAVLHPHVGTMIERRSEVERLLDGSSVGLCLDTGHLAVGGTDPVELAVAAPDRVKHVHLKDVDLTVADGVLRGERSYCDAVRNGMDKPLGEGDVDIAGLV